MFIYTYVYIIQKRLSPHIPRPCRAHKVDTSPAFKQYQAEEIGHTTPVIFNWELPYPHILLYYIVNIRQFMEFLYLLFYSCQNLQFINVETIP